MMKSTRYHLETVHHIVQCYAKPHGEGVEVTKKESIQKRTALRNLVVAYKNQVVDDRKGIGGRGTLTLRVSN